MIQTPRLTLKLISPEYTEHIFKEFTSDITTFMYPKAAEDISETEVFVKNSIKDNEEGKELQIVILKQDTGEFLGCGGLHHIDRSTPELGIWLKKSAHGNGYGKEAIIGLKSWADENLFVLNQKFGVILEKNLQQNANVDITNISSEKISTYLVELSHYQIVIEP